MVEPTEAGWAPIPRSWVGHPELGGPPTESWVDPHRSWVVPDNVVGARVGLQDIRVDPEAGQAESGWTPEAGCPPKLAGPPMEAGRRPIMWLGQNWVAGNLGWPGSGSRRKMVEPTEAGWAPIPRSWVGHPELGGPPAKAGWTPYRSWVVPDNVVGARVGLQEIRVDPEAGQAESGRTPEAGCPPKAGWTPPHRSWVAPYNVVGARLG